MKPLTERQSAVLAYVVANPGCEIPDIARALGWDGPDVRRQLHSLSSLRFVARQASFMHSSAPHQWHPDQKALDAYERARALSEAPHV